MRNKYAENTFFHELLLLKRDPGFTFKIKRDAGFSGKIIWKSGLEGGYSSINGALHFH